MAENCDVPQVLNKKEFATFSKDEIIKILEEENPPIENGQNYNQLMLIWELKKIKENIGLLKGEVYMTNKLEYRGSLLIPLGMSNQKQATHFDEMKEGEYKFYGFTLDSREPKLPEKVINFIKRSFEDSTIQDFIPFVGSKNKSE